MARMLCSIWANQFKVGTYNLDTSIEMYKNYVLESDLKYKLGKKLGCFCAQK